MKWLNAFGGEWRNDLILGSDVLLSNEFYQPLSTRQYFFVAPRVQYSINQFNLYAGNLEVAEYRDQIFAGGFDLGANFAQYGEARIGAVAGTRDFKLQSGGVFVNETSTGPPTFATPPSDSLRVGAFTASVKLDRLDSITFPRHGYYARGSIYASTDLLGANETYTRWNAVLNAPITVGRHTLEALVAGGGRIGDDPIPVYDQFPLGGFLNLSGLAPEQLRTDRYAFGRLIYRSRLAEMPLFGTLQVGGSLEIANLKPYIPIWQHAKVEGDLTVKAGSIFVGVDSPLGPLFLGYGYANRDNKAVYLFLGLP